MGYYSTIVKLDIIGAKVDPVKAKEMVKKYNDEHSRGIYGYYGVQLGIESDNLKSISLEEYTAKFYDADMFAEDLSNVLTGGAVLIMYEGEDGEIYGDSITPNNLEPVSAMLIQRKYLDSMESYRDYLINPQHDSYKLYIAMKFSSKEAYLDVPKFKKFASKYKRISNWPILKDNIELDKDTGLVHTTDILLSPKIGFRYTQDELLDYLYDLQKLIRHGSVYITIYSFPGESECYAIDAEGCWHYEAVYVKKELASTVNKYVNSLERKSTLKGVNYE